MGELKKKRYVYYRCTGNKGKCPEPYVREEVLERQFTAGLRRLKFDDEVLAWVKQALRQSHADERREHEEAITRLQAEHTKIQRRLDAMYDDKLDGVIDEAFFRRKAADCRAEQAKFSDEIERHRQANQNYIEDGARLLDLANKAAELFEKQPAPEKRKLLRFVLSGCTWKSGELGFEYRKPFDLIAEFERAEKTRKLKTPHSNRNGDRGPGHHAGEQVPGNKRVAPISIVAGKQGTQGQTAQHEIWLPGMDSNHEESRSFGSATC